MADQDLANILLEATESGPVKSPPKAKPPAERKPSTPEQLADVITGPAQQPPQRVPIGTDRSVFLSPIGDPHLGPLEAILGAKVSTSTPYTEIRPLPEPNTRLAPGDIARLAYQAGFRGDALVTAVAVSLAESIQGVWNIPGDTNRVGERTAGGQRWGPSLGLWQVRSIQELAGTGEARDPVSLLNPAFNAKAAFEISRGGKNFQPWTVFKKGTYKAHLASARKAIEELGNNIKIGLVFTTEAQASAMPTSLMGQYAPDHTEGGAVDPGYTVMPIPTNPTAQFTEIPVQDQVRPSNPDAFVEAGFAPADQTQVEDLANPPQRSPGNTDAVKSMVRTLFISFWGREPTPQEVDHWAQVVGSSDDLMMEFQLASGNRPISA